MVGRRAVATSGRRHEERAASYWPLCAPELFESPIARRQSWKLKHSSHARVSHCVAFSHVSAAVVEKRRKIMMGGI
jgi:hypothetical protein